MSSVYSNIARNKRETVVVMSVFVLMITVLGWVFGEMLAGDGQFFIGLALVFSGISGLISYYNSDRIVLALSGAVPASKDEYPELFKLVENLCIASGLPIPRIFIINDTALNAFATGRDPEHAALCFTSGIVASLEKRELEGVIAHELSHVQNYDIRLMSLVSILVGTVALLSDWFTRGVFYGSNNRRRNSPGGVVLLIGIGLMILSPLIATLIKLSVSRKREFLADSSGVMITRNPLALADALRKISGDTEVLEAANSATAHLYISNPLKNSHAKRLFGLFNTHPPVEERISRLLQM